ncbi:MAG: ABC-2 family transporter protein [Chloroflexaceae bacterium]|jgi:ABC-2 type transport system permease protein|nr:ABC-2 family transporter protein [Chloroflexaceae bacterium]
MNLFRLSWLYFRVGALNELQYRVNFFVQLVQSLVALGVGLAGLALVFSHTTDLAGWSQAELLAVMGVHILMGGLIRMLIQPNMQRLLEDVQEGSLDFALTKPEDSQLIVSVREIRIWQAVDVVTGLTVLGVALALLQGSLGLWQSFGFALALLCGGLMIYCFWLMITTVAFWVVRMDEIINLFEGVYAAGRYPVGIYPEWLRIGLTFLVPVAFAVTVPAEALTNRLTWQTLLGAVGLALALLLITRWFWRFGLRHYSGASA